MKVWATSLKKVWSFDHHWSIVLGSRLIDTISAFIRATHARQTAIAPAPDRIISMPVLSSDDMPHSA